MTSRDGGAHDGDRRRAGSGPLTALDLDALYGRGPQQDKRFYAPDGLKPKIGTTATVPIDAGTNVNRTGFDVPRVGTRPTKAAERKALIPDTRNDENLAVAQIHAGFINFHNRVIDHFAADSVPSALLFEKARGEVVRHYQWMLREDYLPRIVNPMIVDDVFTDGRKYFDPQTAGGPATMPIEFSVAAFRLGHSMVRETYSWNRIFEAGSPLGIATLFQLFTFSGTAGTLGPTNDPADSTTRTRARSCACRPTGSWTGGGCSTSARTACRTRRACRSTRRGASTRCWRTRWTPCRQARSAAGRAGSPTTTSSGTWPTAT
ncbi:hypothetical protein GCM10022380_34570 [Amycolatopsis tucumanensis]|uniref:Animal haem peroxidase n=2 Tax=Amycolatopsis tucumanensis TaxID=401106 RepID=A0ABP7IAJ6_9PSEU